MSRWYDKYDTLGKNLDKLKGMEQTKLDKLIVGIINIAKEHDPNLLHEFLKQLPMNISRKRWYDKDPYLWIIFNGLKYADQSLLKKVDKYLLKELP